MCCVSYELIVIVFFVDYKNNTHTKISVLGHCKGVQAQGTPVHLRKVGHRYIKLKHHRYSSIRVLFRKTYKGLTSSDYIQMMQYLNIIFSVCFVDSDIS